MQVCHFLEDCKSLEVDSKHGGRGSDKIASSESSLRFAEVMFQEAMAWRGVSLPGGTDRGGGRCVLRAVESLSLHFSLFPMATGLDRSTLCFLHFSSQLSFPRQKAREIRQNVTCSRRKIQVGLMMVF